MNFSSHVWLLTGNNIKVINEFTEWYDNNDVNHSYTIFYPYCYFVNGKSSFQNWDFICFLYSDTFSLHMCITMIATIKHQTGL